MSKVWRPVLLILAVVVALTPSVGASTHSSPTCGGQPASIVGTGGDDELFGTSGPDVIVGLGGNDVIHGGLGHDVVCGGPGDDQIYGGRGHDRLYGQRDDDLIHGDGGRDVVSGGPDPDELWGDLGRDRVAGLAGEPDECWGELVACEIEHRTRHDGVFRVDERRDVAYGSADGQTLLLDVWEQRLSPAGAGWPAVVFAHGGGFASGSKDNGVARSYTSDLAARGFVTASINYRLAGEVSVEAFEMAQHDMQAAVRWVRANSSELGVDPDRIFVSGYSAGAIAAGYTNFNAEDPGTSGNPDVSSEVAGAMPLAGFAAGGLVDAGEPPIRFFQGARDTTVPLVLPQTTCRAAVAVDVSCEIHVFDAGHSLEGYHDAILELMVEFVYRR